MGPPVARAVTLEELLVEALPSRLHHQRHTVRIDGQSLPLPPRVAWSAELACSAVCNARFASSIEDGSLARVLNADRTSGTESVCGFSKALFDLFLNFAGE